MKSEGQPKHPVVKLHSVTQNVAAEAEAATADLEVNVIFTDRGGTLAALKTAGALAHNLQARINLLAFQIVPLAFPLTRPPVSIPFTEQRLLDLASQGAQGHLDTSVRLYLCRNKRQALLQVLRPKSIVVIGSRKRWWPTQESKLARMLRSLGDQVIFATLK